MTIGFGSVETNVEEEEEQKFVRFVESTYVSQEYFDEQWVSEIRRWLEKRQQETAAEAELNDNSTNPPQRYTRWWARLVSSPSDLIAIYTFNHINRKHAFSHDGWGLLKTKRLFHVELFELRSRLTVEEPQR